MELPKSNPGDVIAPLQRPSDEVVGDTTELTPSCGPNDPGNYQGAAAPSEPKASDSAPPAAVDVDHRSPAESLNAASQPADHQGEPATVAGKQKKAHDSLGSVQSIAVTVVIAVFVITFVVQAFQIPSESMEDTLLIGDYLLVDKIHFASGGYWGEVLPYAGIYRGDIIVFRYPVHPQQHFVKRVIGVPGDHVRLRNKQVFVNGQPLREGYVVHRSVAHDPYRDEFPRMDFLNANVEGPWWEQMRSLVQNGELTVPADQYFVLGDNRDESLDSRYWGFVPRQNIIGRPLVIYWSMRHPERLGRLAESPGDKLLYFAYTVTHLLQETRWSRTFHLIH